MDPRSFLQRLLAPLRDRIARGLESPAIITALAAWMLYVSSVAHGRLRVELDDPLAGILLNAARRGAGAQGVAAELWQSSPYSDTIWLPFPDCARRWRNASGSWQPIRPFRRS